MKRAARILLDAVAGVSGLLFVFAVGFWIAGYSARYSVARVSASSARRVETSRGELAVSSVTLIDRPPVPSSTVNWYWDKYGPRDFLRIQEGGFERRSPVAGFSFQWATITGVTGCRILLPMPFVVALLALLPLVDLLVIRPRRRRRYRAAAGLCVRCGYDLRATPAKSPECGAVPSIQPASPDGDGGRDSTRRGSNRAYALCANSQGN
jgi:hypothetical protein